MEVIQKIQRENAGEYSCAASNQIGKNHSKSLHLDIKCKYYYQFMFNLPFWASFWVKEGEMRVQTPDWLFIRSLETGKRIGSSLT